MSYNPSTNQAILTPTVVLAAASPYSVLPADQFIEMSSGANNASTVVNLPAATGSGRVIVIKRMDAFKKAPVNITPNGTDTIDGLAATLPLTAQFESYSLEDAAPGAWAIY